MNEPIRVGLCGIGRAGWGMHCRELDARKDRFTIVAAMDVDESRLEKMRQRYGCRTYTRIGQLARDADVELVDVATPTKFHVDHAVAGLKAGRHVLVEKPFAASFAEARRIAKAAEGAAGRLFVRHNRRFESAFCHIRQILSQGTIGEPFEIKLRRHNYQRRDDWQAIRAEAGGQLLNWGPHIVDHALQFLGSPVKRQWADLKKIAALGDAEDHLKIVLMGENSRVVDLEISGGAALGDPVYTILGTRGALVSDEKTIRIRRLDPAVTLEDRRASDATPPMEGAFGNPRELHWIEETIPVSPNPACDPTSIWDALYPAIREDTPFGVTTAEALEVMRVIDLARKGTVFSAAVRRRRESAAAQGDGLCVGGGSAASQAQSGA